MSYDISLCDPVTRETLHFDTPHQMKGGNYVVGGTDEASLNITYNYAKWYTREDVFGKKGIRTIYELSGAESIPILEKAISALTAMEDDLSEEEVKEFTEHDITGYWMPTRANALRPLHQLLAFAKLRPDGIWEGD